MINEINLRELRKALNEGKRYKLEYGKSTIPIMHDCILTDMDLKEPKTIGDFTREDPCLYGNINNIITPDKKELLIFLKYLNTAIQFEKVEEEIKTTLINRRYTDPMNLLRDYFDLPFLSATHPKLKTSIHKLNDNIISLGITEDLIKIAKSYHPYSASKKYFYYDLDEECKSLKLIKKKIYVPDSKQTDNTLPF